MRTPLRVLVSCMVLGVPVAAQQKPPELTGTLSAFAVAVTAWLDWHLKSDQSASKMFLGSNCGLCKDPKWNVQIKNVQQ